MKTLLITFLFCLSNIAFSSGQPEGPAFRCEEFFLGSFVPVPELKNVVNGILSKGLEYGKNTSITPKIDAVDPFMAHVFATSRMSLYSLDEQIRLESIGSKLGLRQRELFSFLYFYGFDVSNEAHIHDFMRKFFQAQLIADYSALPMKNSLFFKTIDAAMEVARKKMEDEPFRSSHFYRLKAHFVAKTLDMRSQQRLSHVFEKRYFDLNFFKIGQWSLPFAMGVIESPYSQLTFKDLESQFGINKKFQLVHLLQEPDLLGFLFKNVLVEDKAQFDEVVTTALREHQAQLKVAISEHQRLIARRRSRQSISRALKKVKRLKRALTIYELKIKNV